MKMIERLRLYDFVDKNETRDFSESLEDILNSFTLEISESERYGEYYGQIVNDYGYGVRLDYDFDDIIEHIRYSLDRLNENDRDYFLYDILSKAENYVLNFKE